MDALEELTLTALIKRSAELYKDQPALAFVGETPITYGQFYQKINEVSQLLEEQGVNPGDKIAILSESMPNWGIVYFAIIKLGAIAVPILPDFHPNQIRHIIKHSDCKGIFVSEKLYDKLMERETIKLNLMILIETFALIPEESPVEFITELIKKGSRELEKLKDATLRIAGIEAHKVKEDDIACILYTSGTSGQSKGVMLTHKNLVANATFGSQIVDVSPKDRFLSILPLSHTYECTVGFLFPLLQGASIHYLTKPPTASVLIPAMAKVNPTYMLSIPLVIEKIFRLKVLPQLTGSAIKRKLYKIPWIRKKMHKIAGKKLKVLFGGALRFYGVGGAPLAPDVEKFLREADFPYSIGYGTTETAPLIAGAAPGKTKYRSTGPVFKGMDVKIDKPNPETGEGEIFVKGISVMKGYYLDKDLTANSITDDGWYKTGDLGVLDDEGFLYIRGRLKNMIIGPSGENIYPEEIETYFYENDNVVEVIVHELENKLVARVHLDYEKIEEEFANSSHSESKLKKRIDTILLDIKNQVNDNVPRYCRINKIIEQTEPFEKTPTKKVKRYLYLI
jgi:long-chain acyl-CoA synthetase